MKVLLIDQIAMVNYKYSFSLANHLKQQGNDIVLVIDEKKGSLECDYKIENKFLTSNKEVNKLTKIKNYISSFKFVAEKAIHEKFNIVHVQWFQLSPVDYFYLRKMKRKGIKVVATVHDILPFNEKFYDVFFHKKIYEMCDNIIVQAESNIKRFDNMFPNFSEKVVYIPHGHFLDYADSHEEKESRKKLGIPEDKIVLLFFGQIKKVKGVGILLEAFGEICKKRDDIFLVLAGSVWKDDFSQYQLIIEKYNLTNQIKMDIRYIPDEEIGYYYSACDVAMLPYLDVYQSGVIQLAYAYGKPTIATNIGAFQEIVIEGETGFLCDPGNTNDLIRAIERMADNVDELPSIGKAGQKLIRNKYSWENIAEKITDLYQLNDK